MGLFDNISGQQWGQAAGGLFSQGLSMLTEDQKRKQLERMIQAQAPNVGAMQTLGATALGQAGAMDPNAFARQQFEQQQGLRAGADAASWAALQRDLARKGMLGLGSDDPGAAGALGVAPGMRMNPQVAAYFAAQSAQRAKDVAGSMEAGQTQLDRLLARGTGLSRAAQAGRGAGITNVTAAGIPAKRGFRDIAMNVGGDLLKQSGLFGTIGESLKKLFSGGTDLAQPDFSGGYY